MLTPRIPRVIARFGKLPKEIKDKIYKLALVIKMDGSEPAMLIALRGDKSYDKFKEFYDSANFDVCIDSLCICYCLLE